MSVFPYDYGYNYDLYRDVYQMSTGTTFFSLLVGALVIVALWFLYQKAGEPGWAAIVPFYNLYVLFKITWGNGWLFLLLLIPIANFIIMIITWVKFAQAFGKGGGWACGLIFLGFIFLPIMAFSNDIVYVGVPGKTDAYGAGYGQSGYQNPYSQGYQNPYSQPGYQQPNQQKTYQQSTQNSQYYYQQTSNQSGPKYCSGCGTSLENNEKFCPKCGKQQ